MSGDKENEQPATGRPRRSSLAELFASRPLQDSSSANGNAARPIGTSMASAMSQSAQQDGRTRRLSLTTLGLSGSPTHGQQTSPFGTLRRGQSSGPGMTPAIDEAESAVEVVEPSSPGGTGLGSSPSFGRRLSFGARAYRELRSSGGAASSDARPTSPTAQKPKEGFNFAESLRSRAERSSVSGVSGGGLPIGGVQPRPHSTAGTDASPPQPAPKPAPKAPDHFQERILKGDFYMD